MYFIAPLLFWACSEMTCGFFILCVPCLPVILKESRVLRKILSALGITMGSSAKPSNSDLVTFGGSGPASNKKSKGVKSMTDTYFKIDEEDGGLPMGDLEATESQERLHREQNDKGQHITRTTQVTVSSDSRTDSTEPVDDSMPWARVR